MAATDAIFDFFRRRRANYQMVFSRINPADMEVLADLQDFCHGNSTTAVSDDPIQLAIREGRRQVYLRIVRAINLTPEEQFDLARKKDTP